MAVLAMYNAVVAIEGGYEPYAAHIRPRPGADVRAAVATAAYLTARARVAPSRIAYLDHQYAAYLAGIADGRSKTEGIDVGVAAATGMLDLRANDGFANAVLYQCRTVPPPPESSSPTPAVPPTLALRSQWTQIFAQVTPFTFSDSSRFRPDGPGPLTSKTYTDDFVETRDYGRLDSMLRSPEQTDIAYFWAEHPYVHWNRNLIGLASSRNLSILDTARLFAIVHTAAADATISGFEAKYHYAAWRPRTAIPRADSDGNLATDADPTWIPLLTVNHPDTHRAMHSGPPQSLTPSPRSSATDKVRWTIRTSKTAVPQVMQTERTYHDLNALTREIDDARVWAGLHWRHSMRDGAEIGHRVASHVAGNFFRATQ